MQNQTTQDTADPHSDNKHQELRIENERMRQKLQAEAGAIIDFKEDLPPELENLFLQNVIAFEEASQDMKMISLYDFLGRPEYKTADELTADEIETELARLKLVLEEKQVLLDILDTYEDVVIYRFVTEELFRQQTYEALVPGMVRHFTYEAFYPNHKIDIRERMLDFLGDWFDRTLDEHSWELNAEFILPDSRVFSRTEAVQKIKAIFALYTSFKDCRYVLGDITYQWDEEKRTGLGFAEGAVKYTAVPQDGEPVELEGPFKLFLSHDGTWWSIFYFTFPGFKWYDEQ